MYYAGVSLVVPLQTTFHYHPPIFLIWLELQVIIIIITHFAQGFQTMLNQCFFNVLCFLGEM